MSDAAEAAVDAGRDEEPPAAVDAPADAPTSPEGRASQVKHYLERKTTEVLENDRVKTLLAHERTKQALEVTGNAARKTAEVAASAGSRVKDAAAPVVERVNEALAPTAAKVGETYEKTREKVGETYEKTRERVGETYEKTREKVGETVNYTKEKTREIWESGRGRLQRFKVQVEAQGAKIGWRGDARETLEAAEAELLKQWQELRHQGAEEINIPARKEYTTNFHVTKGETLRWLFRVKEYDCGFHVRYRKQQFGGAVDETIFDGGRFPHDETIEGSWTADEDRIVVFAFDNSYSKLRSKTVAYLVVKQKDGGEPQKAEVAEVPLEGNTI